MGGRRGGDIWKSKPPVIRFFGAKTRPATPDEIRHKVMVGKHTGTRPRTDPDPTF